MEVQTPPSAPPCWSSVLRQQPEQQKQQIDPFPVSADARKTGVLVGSCKSSKGIAVAVVGANTVIKGGKKLVHLAFRLVSVVEVIIEICGPASRHSLDFLPFTVDIFEPSPHALKTI